MVVVTLTLSQRCVREHRQRWCTPSGTHSPPLCFLSCCVFSVCQVRISNTFLVEGVGEVYAGNVVSGTVSVGDRLLLGPTGPRGAFVKTAVASVHVAR